MQNAPQFVVGFYDTIRAGGVVVPINAMHRAEELSFICENAQVRTLLTAQDLLAKWLPCWRPARWIMQEYWRNPEANDETFITIDGKRFLRTGDLARADDRGNIIIIADRLKRMINASGYKVWPAEVEARLYQHPSIAEVCVIGAKDAYRGQTVKAVAVLKPGSTLAPCELTSWAQSQMAAYKVPRLLEVVDHLPKTAAGKVPWRDLQAAEDAKAPA